METEKRKELTDDTMVRFYNEYGGLVGYTTENVSRTVRAGMFRDVKLKELKQLIIQEGNGAVFKEGYLMIRDNRAREELGLDPLDEFNFGEDKIKKLLKEGSEVELEQYLQYTSNVGLEKVLRVAVELPIQDLNRANLLYAYSGTNVLDIIQEQEEKAEQNPGVRQRIDGRVPSNPAEPRRGRVIPN